MTRYGRRLPKTVVCRKMACGLRSRKQSASARWSGKFLSTKLPIYRFFERRKKSWGSLRSDFSRGESTSEEEPGFPLSRERRRITLGRLFLRSRRAGEIAL